MGKIVITGATGTVGQEVVRLLEAQNADVCALVRDPIKANGLRWQKAQIQRFDFSDPATFPKALEGADKLLLVASNADENLSLFLNRAEKSAVKHLIILSGISAEKYPDMPLAQVERLAYQTRIPFTALRLNWFMQNFSTYFRDEIAHDKQIALPAGDSKSSFIDVRDIAAVAATLLLDEGESYHNKAIPLTGPEALDHSAVAAVIGQVINKEVRYLPISDEEAYFKFIDMGWGKESAAKMVLLYKGVRAGAAETLSPWVERILGRPPITFLRYVEDFAATWRG